MEQIKIPIEELCKEDRVFVELQNPPELKVEYRESGQVNEYCSPHWYTNSGQPVEGIPMWITPARFGAKILKMSNQLYNHELTVEVYALSRQRLDQDKYHLLARAKSPPFRFAQKNWRNEYYYEFEDPNTYKVLKYNLYDKHPRGEKLGEFLLVVCDERGEIIAYNASMKWLMKYHDRLEALPIGSWLNDECIRVHPTSPNGISRNQRIEAEWCT